MPSKEKIYELSCVKTFIINKIGELGYSLVKIGIQKKKKFLEEELAQESGVKIADARSALNKLNYYGIAMYSRKKNTKTGWVTYRWVFDKAKMGKLILNEIEDKEGKLKNELKNMEGYEIYCCSNKCKNLPFEVAIEYNFRCPSCNKVLNRIDSNKEKIEIEKIIRELGKEKEDLNKHIK